MKLYHIFNFFPPDTYFSRGSRASSVGRNFDSNRSRSTSPFSAKQPPRSPEATSSSNGSLEPRMTRSTSSGAAFSNGSASSDSNGLHNNGETTVVSEAANHKENANEESNKTGLVKVRILTCCADNRHRISPSSFGSFLKFHRFFYDGNLT